MYLLDRATLALYNLRGDYSRERKDQLLGSLDRKYAAGDVVQIQIVRREWEGLKQAANIAYDWILHKQNSAPFSTIKVICGEQARHMSMRGNTRFISPGC